MNWDAIGAIGEIVGAAAVVLTLGYLAMQIRHSERATTDSNRMARYNGVREWLHWGQYASTMDERDRQELQNLIQTWYATAPIKYQWDNSPIAKPIMHKPWIDFVDSVLHDSNPPGDQ